MWHDITLSTNLTKAIKAGQYQVALAMLKLRNQLQLDSPLTDDDASLLKASKRIEKLSRLAGQLIARIEDAEDDDDGGDEEDNSDDESNADDDFTD